MGRVYVARVATGNTALSKAAVSASVELDQAKHATV